MCDDYFDDDSGECGDSENCSDDLLDDPFDEEADGVECSDYEVNDEEDTDVSESAEDEVLPTFDMVVERENRLKLLNSKSNK
ncbi:MAG: hypothetical protein JZU65_05405 [Chlorobium sp.]|nr:hypothetical protein [Chlorobium sp.]